MKAWVLAALALLAGCATPPAADLGPPTSGRMSVRVQAHEGRPGQSQSGAFEWRGSAERGELRLFTPLGTQAAWARWAPGEVRLQDAQGERRFPSLEALSQHVLGEVLPLVAWADWLVGRPWAGALAQALPSGQGFAQLGWSVDLSRQAEGRIVAQRDAPPTVTVLILVESAAPQP